MRLPLVLPLLVLLATPAAGQSVEGRVTDAETGEPVVGAAVRLAGTERGVAADAGGRYALALGWGGPFRLVVSAVGYAAAEEAGTVATGETLRLDVALAPRAVEAGTVVVTATRTAKALADVAVPMTVVDAEAIRRQGAVRLGDVLEDVASSAHARRSVVWTTTRTARRAASVGRVRRSVLMRREPTAYRPPTFQSQPLLRRRALRPR